MSRARVCESLTWVHTVLHLQALELDARFALLTTHRAKLLTRNNLTSSSNNLSLTRTYEVGVSAHTSFFFNKMSRSKKERDKPAFAAFLHMTTGPNWQWSPTMMTCNWSTSEKRKISKELELTTQPGEYMRNDLFSASYDWNQTFRFGSLRRFIDKYL